MEKTTNKGMMLVILIAAVLIAGSLIFLGTQIIGVNRPAEASSSDDPQAEIRNRINEAIKKQLAETEEVKTEEVKTEEVKTEEVKVEAVIPPTKINTEIFSAVINDFTDDDPFMGDKNAPVTLIEWSDYECPYCKTFFNDALPEIKEKYIKTGKVKFVYRDFPLSFHKNAYPAAIAAECAREQADDEMYFRYHDLIFENQSRLNEDNLKQFASDLGLKTDQFNNCLDSRKYKDEAKKDFIDGQSAGVRGTPGFLLNGRLISGAQPYSVFEAAIEKALQQ